MKEKVTMEKTTSRMKMINIDELVPYANNARTHSKNQINKLRGSLMDTTKLCRGTTGR